MAGAISLKIGNHDVRQRAYVIAEAGTCHGGDETRARNYIAAAHMAGADAVKFQIFVPDEALFCHIEGDDKRLKRWRKSMLGLREWERLAELSQKLGIDFLASVFQPTAIKWLKQLHPTAIKVASRAALSFPYDEFEHPYLVSLGMCSDEQFIELSDTLHQKRKQVIWLLCKSEYPSPVSWLNLHDIRAYRRHGAPVGVSDHSASVIPGIAAMTAGAAVVEVHYAIDRRHAGNDAPACLNVEELQLLCGARDALVEMRLPRREISANG